MRVILLVLALAAPLRASEDVGWYERTAQERLDAGDATGAVALAHEGLALYPEALGLNRIVGRHDPNAAGDRSQRKSVQAGNFTVRFRGVEPDADVEARMLEGLAEAEAKLGRDFGFRMDRPVNVIVYASGQDFVASPGTAAWHEANYNGSLQLPLELARMERAYFVDVLTHELAHHMVHLQAHNRVPQWFNEGVAQLAASPAGDDAAMKAAIAGGTLFKLAQLSRAIAPDGDPGRTGATYAQAYSVVKALTERFGFKIVNDLLSDMQEGSNFETAFQSRTGLTVANFERDWLAAQ